jgi:tetratricopeptide (TPR) repeat protein
MSRRRAARWWTLPVAAVLVWALPGRASALDRAASPPAQGTAVRRIAVFPVENLRKSEEPHWLAAWLEDALSRSLVLAGRQAVLPLDTARQWRRVIVPGAGGALPPDAWDKMGVDAVARVGVQPVMKLVEVHVRVEGRFGELLPPGAPPLRVDLAADSPASALARVLVALRPAWGGGSEEAPPGTAQPPAWETLEAAYSALSAPPDGNSAESRPARMILLEAYSADAGLAGPVNEALARLGLEQALLHQRAAAQAGTLRAALARVDAAIAAEPWNSGLRSLKGEILYFLRQDYPAKTEASIARLKNPLDGLAYAVLGLVAGLSTGEASEQFRRARQADPFLWASARAPGQPPFQSGVLEPFLRKWEQLRAGGDKSRATGGGGMSAALREGIALFEARQYAKAQAKLRQAGEEDEYDFRPVLYQWRISVRTGRAAEAVTGLRELAAEFPEEPDVRLHLGVALAHAGAGDEARNILEAVLREFPRQPEALYALALVESASKRWEQAVERLRVLVGLQPRDEAAWLQLGIAQAGMEQWQSADESFRRVLSLNPVSKPAQEWRARIRQKFASQQKPTN